MIENHSSRLHLTSGAHINNLPLLKLSTQASQIKFVAQVICSSISKSNGTKREKLLIFLLSHRLMYIFSRCPHAAPVFSFCALNQAGTHAIAAFGSLHSTWLKLKSNRSRNRRVSETTTQPTHMFLDRIGSDWIGSG